MYSVSYYWCERFKTLKYFKTLHEATQFTLKIPTGSVYGVYKEDDSSSFKEDKNDDDCIDPSIKKD